MLQLHNITVILKAISDKNGSAGRTDTGSQFCPLKSAFIIHEVKKYLFYRLHSKAIYFQVEKKWMIFEPTSKDEPFPGMEIIDTKEAVIEAFKKINL